MIPSGRSRTLTGQLTNPIDSHTVHIAVDRIHRGDWVYMFITIINLQIVSLYLYMQSIYVGKSPCSHLGPFFSVLLKYVFRNNARNTIPMPIMAWTVSVCP